MRCVGLQVSRLVRVAPSTLPEISPSGTPPPARKAYHLPAMSYPNIQSPRLITIIMCPNESYRPYTFDKGRECVSAYRPFTKQHATFDARLIVNLPLTAVSISGLTIPTSASKTSLT
jgi:hypothetical protein